MIEGKVIPRFKVTLHKGWRIKGILGKMKNGWKINIKAIWAGFDIKSIKSWSQKTIDKLYFDDLNSIYFNNIF
jgi:hypothetical protein